MIKAMQCNGGVYRVEEENGQAYVYDSYDELTQSYDIVGVLSHSMSLTFVVTRKAAC